MLRKTALAALCAIAVLGGSFTNSTSDVQAQVASSPPYADGTGKEWRQLTETVGPSWSQVAAFCPQDGAAPCTGPYAGWVWGTSSQVLALLQQFDPSLTEAAPSSASIWGGIGFVNAFRPTQWFANTYSSSEWAGGWTASKDANGLPIGGGGGWSTPPHSGGIGLGPDIDAGSPFRGVFLFRQAGLDYTPPTITANLSGTLGANGWYISDVGVSWTIIDPDSAITATSGCDPSSVTGDTPGITFTCAATSQATTASKSVTVKRDTTPPGVVCNSPAPVFELGQPGAQVSASVTDSLSGALSPTGTANASTAAGGSFTAVVTGRDGAGNTASVPCGYSVVIPTCQGYAPTILGTAGNDVLNGTAGRDVILALGGNDTIRGNDGNDVICGGDGADTIYGGYGDDLVDAGNSNDNVYGDAGKDSLNGGAGDDMVDGGEGDDTLDGGADNDTLYGQGGKDLCRSGEVRASSCNAY